MSPLVLILWAVLGCSTPAPSPEDRLEAAISEGIAALDADPAQAAEALLEAPQEIQQGMLWAMVAHDTEKTMRLCGLLRGSPLRGDCQRLTNRPHLFPASPASAPTLGSGAGLPHPGPEASSFEIPAGIATHHPEAALEDDCGALLGADLCRLARAEQHSMQGEAALAGGWCHRIQAQTWHAECHLRSAENLVLRGGEGTYTDAAALCLHAGRLVGRCLDRLQESIGQQAPPSDAPAEAWAPMQARLTEVRRFWLARWPGGESRAVQGLLATTAANAVALSEDLGGAALLQILGEEAVPHVRAALAARLIRDTPVTTRTLADLAQQVQALAAQTPPPRQQPRPAPRALEVRDLWLMPAVDSRDPRVIPYLTNSRRIQAEDPDADAAIAVLEAAARWATEPRLLLIEGKQHPDPLVRWTAERLQQVRSMTGQPPVVSLSPDVLVDEPPAL